MGSKGCGLVTTLEATKIIPQQHTWHTIVLAEDFYNVAMPTNHWHLLESIAIKIIVLLLIIISNSTTSITLQQQSSSISTPNWKTNISCLHWLVWLWLYVYQYLSITAICLADLAHLKNGHLLGGAWKTHRKCVKHRNISHSPRIRSMFHDVSIQRMRNMFLRIQTTFHPMEKFEIFLHW